MFGDLSEMTSQVQIVTGADVPLCATYTAACDFNFLPGDKISYGIWQGCFCCCFLLVKPFIYTLLDLSPAGSICDHIAWKIMDMLGVERAVGQPVQINVRLLCNCPPDIVVIKLLS